LLQGAGTFPEGAESLLQGAGTFPKQRIACCKVQERFRSSGKLVTEGMEKTTAALSPLD
jgi:hypothetical protein